MALMRVKPAVPKMSSAAYWNVLASPKNTTHNTPFVVADKGKVLEKLELPIAGIMSDEPLKTINEKLEKAKEKAFDLKVNNGIDPFMTLSFMALPVIPKLRLTTRGVIDVENQKYV